jgi:hypothetical protein
MPASILDDSSTGALGQNATKFIAAKVPGILKAKLMIGWNFEDCRIGRSPPPSFSDPLFGQDEPIPGSFQIDSRKEEAGDVKFGLHPPDHSPRSD